MQSRQVKKTIFRQSGRECVYTRKLDKWILPYRGNVQASRYREKLEFNSGRTKLILTGKKAEGCACAFADCAEPPRSLCHYCCKNFQQELFGMLPGREVSVSITESYLPGSGRCNTVIGPLEPDMPYNDFCKVIR